MDRSRGPNSIIQEVFNDVGGSNKVSDCLPAGMNITAADMATSSYNAGTYSLLRVRVTAATYVAFSDDDDKAALDAATIDASYSATECIELFTAGTYLISCPEKWVRFSTQPARVEISEA